MFCIGLRVLICLRRQWRFVRGLDFPCATLLPRRAGQQNRALPHRFRHTMKSEGAGMTDAPNTIIVLFLFPMIFVACILWATHGHPADANNEDLSVVAKDH